MKLLTQAQSQTSSAGVLAVNNSTEVLGLSLHGVQRIDLHFPKFTDGRAFSQAVLLRRRLGFQGSIRATGDVLIDQLLQMQRCGFSEAVLRADQDLAHGERLLRHFSGFYQHDDQRDDAHDDRRNDAPPGPLPATRLHANPSADFDAKLAQTEALLRQANADFQPLKQASSLGAEDVVISHLIDALALNIPLFVLDTGALHAETLALLERTEQSARLPVTVYRPKPEAVLEFVGREGADAMRRSVALRKACCGIRKMEPLGRALQGQKAWVTGLRREQSHTRADVPLIDTSELAQAPGSGFASAGLTKFNPLAHWTWGDVWHYIATRGVDYNPLHDQFYPSIGCAPCTRAISLGEDFRSGRWWWEDDAAKECGLHAQPSQTA